MSSYSLLLTIMGVILLGGVLSSGGVLSNTSTTDASFPMSLALPSTPISTLTSPIATHTTVAGRQSPSDLAHDFQLPAGYLAEQLFVPPLPGIIYIARSQTGLVYVSHFIQNAGISLLDLVTKKAVRILDLPSEAGESMIVGGPGDTALMGVNGDIWQVHPDGSHAIWGKRGGRPQFFTSDGHLLGSTHDGTSVVELFPDGSVHSIAAGFGNIFNVVASADGRIYVSDWNSGNITRIDTDGSQHVLAEQLVVNDPIDLGIDEAGNLYFNSASSGPLGGFVKVDSTTGAATHFDLFSQTCTEHLTDFVFIAPGKVVFVDPTISQIVWDDLNTHEGGLVIGSQGANTHAADIGPDDALYIGTRGCGAELPAQIFRIRDDGTRQVYVDGLEGDVRDIAFDPNGGLYIATSTPGKGGALLYVAAAGANPVVIPGATSYDISSIAIHKSSGHLLATQYGSDTIAEFALNGYVAEHLIGLPKRAANFIIDTSEAGLLYAFVSEWERRDTGPVVDRWLLSIDLTKGTSSSVFAYPHVGCCVMGNLSIDRQGALWWLVNPEFQIYRVSPSGVSTLFAQNLPIDPAAISVDGRGDIYFTSSGGIYRIFESGPNPPAFTDDLLQPGVTSARAVHFYELRQAIDTLRLRFNLGVFSWTDQIIVVGATPVKAVHLAELRSALQAVYEAAGRTAPTYTHVGVTGGATVITAVDITELRAAVVAVW